jgi:hypothetical protein
MITKICKECGAEFKVWPSSLKRRKMDFCSRECYYKWKLKNPKKEKRECLMCKKIFYISASKIKEGRGKFCSKECASKWLSENNKGKNHPQWNRIERKCAVCQRTFFVQPSKIKNNGGRFCSIECKYKWLSEHKKSDKIEKTCLMCGEKFYVIPSRQEKKFCSKKCAGEWYSKNIRGERNPKWKRVQKVCEVCHKIFYVTPKYAEKGYGRFCSQECMAKAFSKKKRRVCLECKTEFWVSPSKIKDGYGKFCSQECVYKWMSKNMNGEKSPSWKGGATSIKRRIRGTSKYFDWRLKVFERDNFTCQRCGKRGSYLHAHHKKPFGQILDELKEKYPLLDLYYVAMTTNNELWDINNGITLCEKCHKEVHKEIENKKEQLLLEVK